jgi:S1-C subfamily serine protease
MNEFHLNLGTLEYMLKTAQASVSGDPIKDAVQESIASSCTIIVQVAGRTWTGSGFHVGNGYIATDYHVVQEAIGDNKAQIIAAFSANDKFTATIVVVEQSIDLALLHGKGVDYVVPAAKLGDSDEIEIGDQIAVISSPEGWHDTVTWGRISNKNQSLRDVSKPAWNDMIFIDAKILEGSSGGMVVGTDGKVYGYVLGVTGKRAKDLGIGENAVSPINKLKRLLDEL